MLLNWTHVLVREMQTSLIEDSLGKTSGFLSSRLTVISIIGGYGIRRSHTLTISWCCMDAKMASTAAIEKAVHFGSLLGRSVQIAPFQAEGSENTKLKTI